MTKKVERGKCSPLVLFNFLWTHGLVAYQAPLSVGFSRQEYCSGLPCPPPGDLPDPGIDHGSLALQADSWLLSHQGSQRWQSRIYGPFKINCSFFFSFFNGQILWMFHETCKIFIALNRACEVQHNILFYSMGSGIQNNWFETLCCHFFLSNLEQIKHSVLSFPK